MAFLLADKFTLSAFATFVDVLRLAADEGDRSRPIRCRWSVLSPDASARRSSCGVRVATEPLPPNPEAFDYVVVVGGLIDERTRLDPRSETFVRRAAEANVPLVGLCTGVFALYRAGVMAGYRACVSFFHRADFLREFGDPEPVCDRIFLIDRSRLTSSGGASAAHLAAAIVGRHLGEAAARKSLSIMMIDPALGEEAPQPLGTSPEDGAVLDVSHDPLVRRALALQRDA
ncbi:MAG: DJ-1/PfpI family protein, partial [Pseudomonadota bacterium]